MFEMTPDTLYSSLSSLYEKLFKARHQKSCNQLEDPSVIGLYRHQISQIKTVLKQKNA